MRFPMMRSKEASCDATSSCNAAATAAIEADTEESEIAVLLNEFLPDVPEDLVALRRALICWALLSFVFAMLLTMAQLAVRQYSQTHVSRGNLSTLFYALFPTPIPRSAIRAAALLSRRSSIEEQGAPPSYALLDMAIAVVLPLLTSYASSHKLLLPLTAYAPMVLALLLGLRIVAPISSSVEKMCNQGFGGDGHGGSHRQYLPLILQSLLWLSWSAMVASSSGLDLRNLWSSLGMTGLLLGFALQQYAADVAGGFTLATQGRFKVGDCVTLGGSPSWTVTVNKIGFISTQCTQFEFGQPCSLPNSMLVRAALQNDSKLRTRRVPLNLVVDGDTPAAKLAALPVALKDAVKEALHEASLDEGVEYVNEANGQAADLVDAAHPAGIHFQLVINVALQSNDMAKWLRVRSVALIGMLNGMERAGVKRGKVAHAH
uniref:Mechanosensitive ion channel MscS domain-containing protein n=1 Tax=Chrysotila carterae TaxID=13221 RepID=A0A7S4EZ62_CHRCT|mmetsp:Transcript_19171/g.40607  ORF Transcript_19171/g.40607 Transcript_19171/m.40607 type:complete len:432 (+) Transcript_19171:159-1454(+)